MSQATEILVIHSDRDGSALLAQELDRIPTVETRVSRKHNLDGSPAGWFVVAVVAIRSLPAILDAIGRLINLHRVKSIKFGDIELENPTPADVEDLKRSYLKRISHSRDDKS